MMFVQHGNLAALADASETRDVEETGDNTIKSLKVWLLMVHYLMISYILDRFTLL